MSKKLHEVVKNSQQPIQHAKFIVAHKKEFRSLFLVSTCKDGSVMINAGGYFQNGNWRWGHFNIPSGKTGKTNVPMDEKTESHQLEGLGPKVTYHASGIITTTLAGHIKDDKIPRVEGTPLKEVNGHFFTIMTKGFGAFKKANTKKKEYHHIPVYTKTDQELTSLKVVGYLGPLESHIPNQDFDDEELHMIVENINGLLVQSHLFRIKFEDDHVTWLKIQLWPDFPYNEGKEEPSFSILTGWKQEEMVNLQQTAKCLGIIAGA